MTRPLQEVCETRLDNDVLVVTCPHYGGAAAVYVGFRVGSIDERDDEHGLAHFLEHMVFKGTPRRPTGQAAIEIELLGGDLNAWTSTDHTVFHASVEGPHWERALDVITDMATERTLDPDDFEREKDVIVEEISSYDDDPDAMLSERVQEAIWGAHPYGRRILGDEASVRAVRAVHDAPPGSSVGR